jgi:predicted HicB family RNase H-like nuclease
MKGGIAVAEDLKQLKVNVPPELHKRVKTFAAQKELTIQQLVITALEQYLKKKGG